MAPLPALLSAPRARFVLQLLLVAAGYYAAARVGVSLAYHRQDASLVWPAQGVGFAAMLLLGVRIWPAIAGAAVLSALASGAPLLSAAVVAGGNVAGTVAGVLVLRRLRFRPSLEHARDVILLVVAGGMLSAVISATVGVATLAVRGVYPVGVVPTHWLVWWAGDMTGLLTVAPLLLVWARSPAWRDRPRARTEFLGMLALLLVACLVAFGPVVAPGTRYPLPYLVFPFALWAALRFELHGAVTLTAVVAGVAIWRTLQGDGPFTHVSVQQTLVYLQAFVVVVALSTLVLATIMGERRRLEAEQGEMLEREREARLEAQQAAAAREKMLAVVSHEIRNPLSTVLLNSSLIMDSADGMAPWLRPAAESVVVSAEQIEHLIRDLTDVTRLEAGQMEFERTRCPAASLLEQAAQILQPLVEERGVALETRVDGTPPEALANRERVLQVFSNLVGNAIRFTPIGGRITLAAEARGDEILFSVTDTGAGIAPERIDELLRPFWQTPVRLPDHGGLGIPIARAIVEAHGGSFAIESRAGEGTRVSFTLPLAQETTA